MVLNIKKARLNNGILVNRNQNCNEMTASNTSGYASHQYNVLQ